MAALMVAGVFMQSALINTYLIRDFARIEQSQVQGSLRLIQLWLDRFIQPMESLARDVGQTVKGTPGAVGVDAAAAVPLNERLRSATRLGVGYDSAAIIDGAGNVLLAQAHERGAGGAERAPTGVELDLLRRHATMLRAGAEPVLSGWNVSKGGLFGVAGTRLGTGPDAPVVVIGRSFDDAAMSALDDLSGTRVTIVDGEVPAKDEPGRPMQACTRLSPALNARPQHLCVRLQDSIIEKGQRSSDDLRLASIAGFVILMFGTWWFLDRSLLRRLTSLTHQLDSTAPGGTESLEAAMLADGARGDELGRMSMGIGQLLGRVRQAEADMRERERSFRVLAESSGVAIFVIRDGVLYSNPFASRLTGCSKEELRKRGSLAGLFVEGWRERFEAALAHGSIDDPEGLELRGRRDDGTLYWARLHVSRIDYRGGPALLVTLFDVTEQRRLERGLAEEKQNLQVILSSIHDGIVAVDPAGAVRFINPAAQRLTGVPVSLANGSPLDEVVVLSDPDRNAPLPSPLLGTLEAGGSAGMVANITTPQGQSRNVEVSVSRSQDPGGDEDAENRRGSVLVMRDVSDLRQLTRVLAEQASHDELTGLINRREFSRRLHQALTDANGNRRRIALCYVDLDQFKLLNDTCGHHAGDLMLREVAEALRGQVREQDTLARLGGDEFGVLLDDSTPIEAVTIANALRTRVGSVRFQWNGQSFSVDASIGIAMLDQVEGGVDEALALADAACYMAKDLGRNRVHLYRAADADLQQQLRHMRWATRLKEAVENSRFELYAQAIAPVAHGAPNLNACEALVRMRQPDGDVVTPDDFLAAAERYQMMNRIDQWVVRSALGALQRASTYAGTTRPKLFINLSGQSLGDEGFREFLLEQLAQHANLTQQIVFEVTESAVISSLNRAKKLMEDVYSRGCAFALDDFGTGMSSFGYLKELRVDYLKIAGCFVKNVASPLDAAVCRSFTEFARMMRVTVIAEWIEDEQILQVLRDMGVDYGQGWHLGRPQPIDQILRVA